MTISAIATDKLKTLISQDKRFDSFPPSEIESDIAYFAYKLAKTLSFFIGLSDARKIAIIYLCFVIGIHNFLQLEHIIGHLAKGDFAQAASDLYNLDLLEQAKYYLGQLGKILHTNELLPLSK